MLVQDMETTKFSLVFGNLMLHLPPLMLATAMALPTSNQVCSNPMLLLQALMLVLVLVTNKLRVVNGPLEEPILPPMPELAMALSKLRVVSSLVEKLDMRSNSRMPHLFLFNGAAHLFTSMY